MQEIGKKLKKVNLRAVLILGAALIIAIASATGGILADRTYGVSVIDKLFPGLKRVTNSLQQKVVTEESVVIDVAEEVSPSVVTVSFTSPQRKVLQFDPFGGGLSQRTQGGDTQDIGTGFIVSKDGLIITNKHVVSQDGKYKVITKNDTEYEVKEIQKDPNNDIAILKIDASNLTPLELGTSENLKVGQFVIAIGTALGEFRHTVTTGVISGLGRGIQAGSPLEGYVEELDNVIQTDAAINPGNSGGPLLNSAGQVIGVNVAVAQGAQNIGFAIPINTIKASLDEFNKTGKFPAKPYLGVSYQMLSQRTALLNNVPEGAYVVDVVSDSAADKAGIQQDDIITQFDGKELTDKFTLADALKNKKPGDTVTLKVWRNTDTQDISVTLEEATS